VSQSDPAPDPPYLRIVGDIRRRIEAGELRPGDRVPSARQITREWRVAIATATRALATLGQDGLVRPVPGVGTVVAAQPGTGTQPGTVSRPGTAVPAGRRRGAAPRPARDSARELAREPGSGPGSGADREPGRDRVVRTAIGIADAEGLAALSMRRVAGELGIPTMSLYRYVPGKDDLVMLMGDTAIGDYPLPAVPPEGWRAQLEYSARLQWAGYRRHPWLAQSISMTRPQLQANGVAHTEWALRALDGLGLEANVRLHAAVTLFGFVRGLATSLEQEAQARAETGITDDEYMAAQDRPMAEFLATGRFPTFARLVTSPGLDLDLESLFEFGLGRLLDGLDSLIARDPR
jgi:AcrR family transcriptional regulator